MEARYANKGTIFDEEGGAGAGDAAGESEESELEDSEDEFGSEDEDAPAARPAAKKHKQPTSELDSAAARVRAAQNAKRQPGFHSNENETEEEQEVRRKKENEETQNTQGEIMREAGLQNYTPNTQHPPRRPPHLTPPCVALTLTCIR